jgi:hypothetical protein
VLSSSIHRWLAGTRRYFAIGAVVMMRVEQRAAVAAPARERRVENERLSRQPGVAGD